MSWPSSNDSTNRVIQCHVIQPMQPTILDFSEIVASVSTQNEFTKWKFSVQRSLLFWIYDLLRMLPLHLYLVGKNSASDWLFHNNCNIFRMFSQNKLKSCILPNFGVLNLMVTREEYEQKLCFLIFMQDLPIPKTERNSQLLIQFYECGIVSEVPYSIFFKHIALGPFRWKFNIIHLYLWWYIQSSF